MTREIKLVKTIALIWVSILTASCGKKNPGHGAMEVKQSDVIIGDVDWVEVTDLPMVQAARANSTAIADIKLPMVNSRCTGFLITDNIIMTNHHCVPTKVYARGITAVFNNVEGVRESEQRKFNCSKFLASNKQLDFALIKCQGLPGKVYGVAKLEMRPAKKSESIYVIQQNCDYYTKADCDWTKKVSAGNIVRNINGEYEHNADTLGGSSGSPVFSAVTNNVIGLHHAGAGGVGTGRGYANFAVPMYKIIEYMNRNLVHVFRGDQNEDEDDSADYSAQVPVNTSFDSALPLQLGALFVDQIEVEKLVKFYKVKLTEETEVDIAVNAVSSHLKHELFILTMDRKVVGATSSAKGEAPALSGQLPAGEYYIAVRGDVGKYSLSFDRI